MDRTRSSKGLINPDLSSLTDREDLLGQTLLGILSRGAAVLAEIHRLADRVPKEVLADGHDFLFCFDEYFNDPERNETRLNKVATSVQADEDFQAKNHEYLQRFYNVCAGIVRLAADFNRMTRELRKGYFLSHSLEQALLDPDGKQWIPEALHIVGASLLLLNEKFPGKARERLIVAQYRLKGEAALRDFDHVVALVRDFEAPQKASSVTGASAPSEVLLSRLSIDGRLARAIVSRIQADDVYGHTRAWPLAEHRSTALANQASLLYIALLFAEAGLKSKKSTSEILPLSNGRAEMREIVDKHFSDQWVVMVCTGFTVDLEIEWSYFPAARTALADVTSRLQSLKSFNKTQAKRVQSLLDERLTRGVLTERYVTDNWDSLLEVLREANAMLRWRILHGKTKAWTLSAPSASSGSSGKAGNKGGPEAGLSPAETIRLLMATAQLEHVLREAIRRVLASKDETWKTCRERVSERMMELAQYFSGQVPLARVQKDEELMRWFQGLGEEVGRLEYLKTPTAAGRRVQALIKALEEVERFDGVDNSLQVREFLSDSRSLLEKMVRTVNVREEILAQIDVISDLSYAWGGVLDDYDPVWHDRVRQDPSSVGLLRAVFIKFSSILDVALARLAQASSPDVDSVAEYWSKKLVAYVKRVLEVVPQSVCSVLDAVGDVLEKLPDSRVTTRYQLNELGAFAAGEARYDLARYTHKIAIFTGGILSMGKCVLGIVEVDPKRVLDDGLRKELRRRMSVLISQQPQQQLDVTRWKVQLAEIARQMQKLKRAFEYVQDYLTLDGTRTWNEELSKVVNAGPNLASLSLLAKQLVLMDWSNERQYEAVFDDLLKLLGIIGVVCLDYALSLEQKSLTMEFVRNPSNCDVSLTHLNLPVGVVWGSANWVDSVREARRKYPYDQMESDLKCLAKIGMLHLARTKLRFRLAREAQKDAPLLSTTVQALLLEKPSGTDAASDQFLSMALGLVRPPPSVHYDVLDELSTARRVFILLNELAKRIVTNGTRHGVYGNADYYYCCAGVATFYHSKQFTQELNRCVYADARALCYKSLLERQTAESSVLFKFGAQKVAKVALERLVEEQSIHRIVAQLADRTNELIWAPIFVDRIAEIWTSG